MCKRDGAHKEPGSWPVLLHAPSLRDPGKGITAEGLEAWRSKFFNLYRPSLVFSPLSSILTTKGEAKTCSIVFSPCLTRTKVSCDDPCWRPATKSTKWQVFVWFLGLFWGLSVCETSCVSVCVPAFASMCLCEPVSILLLCLHSCYAETISKPCVAS